MLSLMRMKKLAAVWALSVASNFAAGGFPGNAVLAAVSSAPLDTDEDQLRNQLNDIINTPVDFCDPQAVKAHLMAMGSVQYKLTQVELKKPHPPIREMVQHGIQKAVQANDAAGGDLVKDLPYVAEYEMAGTRGDVKAQKELFAKMAPAAQAQAAQHDMNFPLTIQLLTPLANAGDVNAQVRLASIYSMGTTAFSVKYLPPPNAKMLEFMKRAGIHWPLPAPPDDLPLAFKYYDMAARRGNFFGQAGLARSYACGFGTEKNPVQAYMWFSLALIQRGVTVDMAGASLPPEGYQKDYALDRDFLAAQMKPEEIEQSKRMLRQCFESKYRNCN
jgi:hypothetical protein